MTSRAGGVSFSLEGVDGEVLEVGEEEEVRAERMRRVMSEPVRRMVSIVFGLVFVFGYGCKWVGR